MEAFGKWSIKNNVTVNLVMIFIIVAGLFTVMKMRRVDCGSEELAAPPAPPPEPASPHPPRVSARAASARGRPTAKALAIAIVDVLKRFILTSSVKVVCLIFQFTKTNKAETGGCGIGNEW